MPGCAAAQDKLEARWILRKLALHCTEPVPAVGLMQAGEGASGR
jgi:hypothetical protein